MKSNFKLDKRSICSIGVYGIYYLFKYIISQNLSKFILKKPQLFDYIMYIIKYSIQDLWMNWVKKMFYCFIW